MAGFPAFPLQGTAITTSINSAKVGVTYPINIYTPAAYAATTDSLPVIYTLDGGNDHAPRFENIALMLEQQGIRAILVGIGNYARRETDYRLPGATSYYEFLTTELIPSVESKYRVDAKARTLAGHSYGGLFALLGLLMDRPDKQYFSSFIATDGSFWYQPELINAMEQNVFAASGGKLAATTLILSGASGFNGNNAFVEDIYQQLLARNYQGLTLQRLPVYNVSHSTVFNQAFADSLRILFKKTSSAVPV